MFPPGRTPAGETPPLLGHVAAAAVGHAVGAAAGGIWWSLGQESLILPPAGFAILAGGVSGMLQAMLLGGFLATFSWTWNQRPPRRRSWVTLIAALVHGWWLFPILTDLPASLERSPWVGGMPTMLYLAIAPIAWALVLTRAAARSD